MGTRGIMGVRIDGQDKLTYNHYDSYPDGLGEAMVKDIRSLIKTKKMETQARGITFIDPEIKPTPNQIAKLNPYTDLGVSNQSTSDWYCLTRKLQGNLKDTLAAGLMDDAKDFMNNSLFCEWAYIVNFDDGLFEVYRGFQTDLKDQKGRYAVKHKPPFEPSYKGQEQYFPVALIATFPLKDIPKDWIKQLPGQKE